MSGIIIAIQEGIDGPPRYFLEAPAYLPEARKSYPFPSQPAQAIDQVRTGAISPGIIRDAGKRLYACLTGHPAVKVALENSAKRPTIRA